jgi:hypothetical protein
MTHQGASPEDARLAGMSKPMAAATVAVASVSPKMAFTTWVTPLCRPSGRSRNEHRSATDNCRTRISLDSLEQIVNISWFGSVPKQTRFGAKTMDSDRKSAWLRKLDKECPYQVVLPRRQLADDSEILDFLIKYVEKFDMYVEDDYAAFVRYCFADPLDAEIFRSRFEPKGERFRLAG